MEALSYCQLMERCLAAEAEVAELRGREQEPVVSGEKLIGSFDAEKNEIALLNKNTTVESFAHWHAHNKFEVIIRPSRAAMLQVGK